jgi:hypothetical protein
MWCAHCQRDVPAKAVESGGTACARCGSQLAHQETAVGGGVPSSAFVEIAREERPEWEDWSADFDLSEIELALESCRSTAAVRWTRTDAANGMTLPIGQSPIPAAPQQAETGSNPQSRSGVWAWSLVLLGVMGLACGAVLVGCSYWAGRHDLWEMGLPVLLAGQAMLLVGLVLQFERVWHNSRVNSQRLERVDQEISQLNRSTALWATTGSPSATAFYQHLAHGASPHVLLADLKGQMDLLAMRTR